MEQNRTDSVMHRWFIPEIMSIVALDSKPITFGEVFSIFFMQRWGEEWVLIIRKYHGMKSVKLEQCCIDLTVWINRNITNSAITSAILIALPFFKAFFYPYPEKVASMASSAVSVGTEDWKQLAEAIKGVNAATRASVSDAAGRHSFAHHKNRRLKQLWEEISNAFA